GVGGTAAVATAASVALTVLGIRRRDARTVLAGVAFSTMAALLAVHGLMTPGMLVGMNGLIALSGGVTLPVGAAILVLSSVPALRTQRAIPRLLVLQAFLAVSVVTLSLLGALMPSLVPMVPAAKSHPAIALLVFGLALY